ncbi:hypothetical protein SKAU_G00154140 [Synaphobranchus kaupii]|uniref:Uncharacterized protein n=1 Tax=Synaphobranchus kaupii TaxID=118154 RepID=A0A9Q1IWZ6_SYNKA|nr:hypothetical protein SKAU_G00154140 [Synaphobranchus kaupii]
MESEGEGHVSMELHDGQLFRQRRHRRGRFIQITKADYVTAHVKMAVGGLKRNIRPWLGHYSNMDQPDPETKWSFCSVYRPYGGNVTDSETLLQQTAAGAAARTGATPAVASFLKGGDVRVWS